MTPEEILEGNRLIAEFMGQTFENYINVTGNHGVSVRGARYNESWDWLMPVVEKIEDIKEPSKERPTIFYTPYRVDIINRNMVEILKEGEQCIASSLLQRYTKLEALYIAVIKFIKWYNQQKQ